MKKETEYQKKVRLFKKAIDNGGSFVENGRMYIARYSQYTFWVEIVRLEN